MDEDAQQRITYLLQEIDANVCAAHRSATQICGTVRRHHQILRQIHESSRVWQPLFDSFTQQSAARRITRTPSRFSRPFTPVSTRNNGTNQYQSAAEDDEDLEDTSFVSKEQTFKTTTLKKRQPPASDRRNASAEEDSLDASISSDNLPRMSRTPYMSKSEVQSSAKTQESTSTFNSSDHGRWLTSPPRTGIISRDQPKTGSGPRQISTPPSAISSVQYNSNSPGISRNLMKLGAFEYTPPRGKNVKSDGAEMEVDQTTDSIDTPYLPEFSTVRLSTSNEVESNMNADNVPNSSRTSEGAMDWKRTLSSAGDKRGTPVYPKTHYPAKATSPFKSPSLRRKYSSISNMSSLSHRLTTDGHTLAMATPRRQPNDAIIDDDTPRTPEFDLTSPLLRTQLKAMTPNTPLSNRLVGASLDVGSVSQETRLQDYDDSVSAGEPTPKFELSLLPAAFQRGVGAVQVSTLYSKFQGSDDDSPAMSVDQLLEMLPDYGKEKIEILLDTLVSRRLLRPFVVEGTMFWQKAI
ncbi:unnamed protein product [Peronospora belbahrii]|uniref:DASH complex subunit ASK1 n=1 Tax=Peronospora belbahrii TaxID=622444 RepID=A0ABN8CVA7_9STRA|nr:unnamed protein product [Peronospora belbahrii]